MGRSLAVEAREALAEARCRLAAPQLELVERARVSANDATGERDRLLCAVVNAYRIGDRQVWSAVLLDLLAPAMLRRLAAFRVQSNSIDAADLRQQLVVEVLAAAASMPLPSGARFVERRLVLRAGQGVRRWLQRERRWSTTTVGLDTITQEASK